MSWFLGFLAFCELQKKSFIAKKSFVDKKKSYSEYYINKCTSKPPDSSFSLSGCCSKLPKMTDMYFSDFLSSVHGERKGSNVDAAQLLSEGNVSLSLTDVKVVDEGTYICTVSLGHFHAQQVIQLRIIRKFPLF